MNVLLVQYGLNPISIPAVCGNSGNVYGHAIYNQRLNRHEFLMPLERFQSAVVHRDLSNALRRPGCQWYPLFEVPVAVAQPDDSAEVTRLQTELAKAHEQIEAMRVELIGDDTEAPTREDLERKGLNSLRKMARKLGHKLTGGPTKSSLIEFILNAPPATAGVA